MGIKHRLASASFPGWMEKRLLARQGSRAVVLMYHEVLPDPFDLPFWSIVRESNFRAQMLHLRQHYEILSMDDALARMNMTVPAFENAKPLAVVSFDDGYAGNLHCALPILKELRIAFSVYVATANVESGSLPWYDKVSMGLTALGQRSIDIPTSRGPLVYAANRRTPARRWAAVNEILDTLKALPRSEQEEIADRLAAHGPEPRMRMLTPNEVAELSHEPLATIGCHTHGHELLDLIPIAQARRSIMHAQELLESWTGTVPCHFSYPNGNFSTEVVELVKKMNFASAVTTRSTLWNHGIDCHLIPRVGIGRFDSLNLFRAKSSGLFAR